MAWKAGAASHSDVGQYRDVWYYVQHVNNSNTVVTLLVSANVPNPVSRMRLFIKEHKQSLRGMMVVRQKGRYLQFALSSTWGRVNESRVHDVIAFVVEHLPQTGYVPQRHCASCGHDTPHAAVVRDGLMPLCNDCAAAQTQAQASKTVYQGSFMLGLIGALLGAFIGALPWMLVYYFSDLMSGWLSVLIAVGAFTGYKLLNGTKNNVLVRLAVYCSTVFASVFSFVLIFAFVGYEEFGIFSLEWAWFIFSDPVFLSDIAGDLVFSALLSIAGFVIIEAMLKKFLHTTDRPLRFLDPRASQAEPIAMTSGPLSDEPDGTSPAWQTPPANDSGDENPGTEA